MSSAVALRSGRQEGVELGAVPLRSPRHNGKVENANGTVWQEALNFRAAECVRRF